VVLRARGKGKNKQPRKEKIIRWIMTARFHQNREILLFELLLETGNSETA
jgi:hypothetical protein